MESLRLAPGTPAGPPGVEDLYAQLEARLTAGSRSMLRVDLSSASFVQADSLLGIISAARYWHSRTGKRAVLGGMSREVHRYLERTDVFERCQEWLEPDSELPSHDRYRRSHASRTMLGVAPIAGDEEQNWRDVQQAIRSAKRILDSWFKADAAAVSSLLTVLSEITGNVVHSKDQGFAVVQRYRDSAYAPGGSRVAIGVADLGIGIEGSLRERGHVSEKTGGFSSWKGSDFILHALELGVSSLGTVAGTGLNRVRCIVLDWSGTLTIRSHRSMLQLSGDGVSRRDDLPEVPGTQVCMSVRGAAGAATN